MRGLKEMIVDKLQASSVAEGGFYAFKTATLNRTFQKHYDAVMEVVDDATERVEANYKASKGTLDMFSINLKLGQVLPPTKFHVSIRLLNSNLYDY